jgi:hypothetical protein
LHPVARGLLRTRHPAAHAARNDGTQRKQVVATEIKSNFTAESLPTIGLKMFGEFTQVFYLPADRIVFSIEEVIDQSRIPSPMAACGIKFDCCSGNLFENKPISGGIKFSYC